MPLIWARGFYAGHVIFFSLVLWASGFFFSICQPLLSLLSYILFHETESTGIFGKTLLGYVFCCK